MTNRFQKLNAANEAVANDATGYVAILDSTTGLIWSKTLEVGEVNHAKAVKAAADLDLLDKKDWRLPTRGELLTLVDDTRHSPAIDPIFECESDWYWTGTPVACSPSDYAWFVHFSSGYCGWDGHSNDYFVRAVRSSQ